jgi:hypothetical protein
MLDTFLPLSLTGQGIELEFPGYHDTWASITS